MTVVDTADECGIETVHRFFEEHPTKVAQVVVKVDDLGANLGMNLWLSEMVAITVNFNTVM